MYILKKIKVTCILAGLFILTASGTNYAYGNAGCIQEQHAYGVKTKSKQKNTAYKQDKKKTNSFSSIKADVGSLDIVIKQSGDENFYISYNLYCANSSNPVSYNIKNGILEIMESELECLPVYVNEASNINKMNSYRNVIYVYVPPGASINGCNMVIKNGDLDFGKVSLEYGNIVSKNGDIYFDGSVLSDKLNIKTSNGDIYLKGADINGPLDIKSKNGDIYINKSGIPGIFKAVTDNGDLYASKVNIKGKLEFNTSSGDIDIRFLDISGETKINTDNGDIDIIISNRCLDGLNINMFTDNGDISVKKLYKGSKKRKGGGFQYNRTGSGKAVLDVETDSGDILLH